MTNQARELSQSAGGNQEQTMNKAYVNPKLQQLLDTAEQFDDWHQACDAATERDRPIVARVGLEVCKVFPSRACQTLYAG